MGGELLNYYFRTVASLTTHIEASEKNQDL
jgi:hypothetical protein